MANKEPGIQKIEGINGTHYRGQVRIRALSTFPKISELLLKLKHGV